MSDNNTQPAQAVTDPIEKETDVRNTEETPDKAEQNAENKAEEKSSEEEADEKEKNDGATADRIPDQARGDRAGGLAAVYLYPGACHPLRQQYAPRDPRR